MRKEYRFSRGQLNSMTSDSVDPVGFGPVRRDGMNSDLTNSELVSRINQRNAQGKPTYLLRLEYQRRIRRR